jgi:serum/glucocorticoid-regulated kinase 2
MSNKLFDAQYSKKAVNVDSFVTLSVIGKGSYAKVLLVRKKDNGQMYAMKILKKKVIEKKKQEGHIQTERNVLISMKEHPFFVKIHYSFQTEKNLYFIIDYCPGGEIFGMLQKRHRLSENETRFYAAQLILAIEFLHKKNILYRDLKPENVLIDSDGYLKIADFGLSKLDIDKGNAKTICGTPEYLAPEVIKNLGYGKPFDWWTLGSFIYEMLVGHPPFYVSNRSELFDKIKYVNPTYPYYLSTNAKRLIEQLLEKNPDKRLGTIHGPVEIKEHQWFAGTNWEYILEKKIKAPFLPHHMKDLGLPNFDPEFTNLPVDSIEASDGNTNPKNFTNFTWGQDDINNGEKQ